MYDVELPFAHQLAKLPVVVTKNVDAPGPCRIQRNQSQRRSSRFRVDGQGTQVAFERTGSSHSDAETSVLGQFTPHGAVHRDNMGMANGEKAQGIAHCAASSPR